MPKIQAYGIVHYLNGMKKVGLLKEYLTNMMVLE